MMFSEEQVRILEDDTIRHEGFRNKIYTDTVGLATGGIGHLIIQRDEEYYMKPTGTVIPLDQITEWFYDDLLEAKNAADSLVENFEQKPFSVQRVLVNMAFNLGYNRLAGFKKMLEAVNNEDYATAANEMLDSKWARQVHHRATELADIMENS